MWTGSYSVWFPSFLTKNDLVFWLRMGPGPPVGSRSHWAKESTIHLLLKQLFICKISCYNLPVCFLCMFCCSFSPFTAWFWYYWLFEVYHFWFALLFRLSFVFKNYSLSGCLGVAINTASLKQLVLMVLTFSSGMKHFALIHSYPTPLFLLIWK